MQNFGVSIPLPPATKESDSTLTILVVDDSRRMRDRIVEALEGTQLSVVVQQAKDIAGAVDCLAQNAPHIVTLDISMPGTRDLANGIDLLVWIRQTRPRAHVIMLTNLADSAYRAAAMARGAAAFLDKTNEFDQLPAVVKVLANLPRTL